MQTAEQSVAQEGLELAESGFFLRRIYAHEMGEHWPLVKQSLMLSIPSTVELSEHSLAEILSQIMNGALKVWALVEGDDVRAIATTIVEVDNVSATKNLLIYSLYVFEGVVKMETWRELFRTFSVLAKQLECFRIIATTSNARVMQIVTSLGGSIESRIVDLPLEMEE